MPTYDIYGLGAALVDTEIQVSDADLQAMAVEKGVMTLVDQARQQALLDALQGHLVHARRASGGSACNSIIAASFFGARTAYACKVANDENGDFFLNDLRQAGVHYPLNRERPDGITGKCLVMISADAERSMNTFLGISEQLSVSEVCGATIAQSKYVYIEGYLVTSDSGRAAAIHARELAGQQGCKTALSLSDPNMVAFFRDGLQAMLGSGVDILFCNRDEALGWAQTENLEQAAQTLQQCAKSFVITLGAEGALIFDGRQYFEVPGHPVTALDSNGAGDMFAGAFLYALSQDWSYRDAARLAVRASAEVVSHYGPRLPAAAHSAIKRQLDLTE